MTAVPYCQIYGKDISSEMVPDAWSPSGGGGRKSDDFSMPSWKRSQIKDAGREPTSYSGSCYSKTMTNIQALIAEFNRAPEDCEFYPIDSDLCVYVAQAQARYKKVDQYSGFTKNFYHADFELSTREPFAFGPRRGIDFAMDVALPAASASLTNEGNEINTLDYLAASGSYDSLLGYTDDLKLKFDSQELDLCGQLMRNDLFELSRWGEVKHSYKVDWTRCYESLQTDLWGSDFCYGGSIASDILTVASGQVLFPFAGPLPISESPPPTLSFFLKAGGMPTVWKAHARDLSDLAVVDCEIVRGYNSIEIPDCDGAGFTAFGLVGDFVVSDLSAQVNRYLAEFELPIIDVGDSFVITVEDGEYSNHRLTSLRAAYRNKFWW